MWLEVLHNLGFGLELAVKHHEKHFLEQLLVYRQLVSNAHLGHLLQWHLLTVLRPLGQERFDFLLDCRLAGGHIKEQNQFGTRRHQQLPCSGRRCILLR